METINIGRLSLETLLKKIIEYSGNNPLYEQSTYHVSELLLIILSFKEKFRNLRNYNDRKLHDIITGNPLRSCMSRHSKKKLNEVSINELAATCISRILRFLNICFVNFDEQNDLSIEQFEFLFGKPDDESRTSWMIKEVFPFFIEIRKYIEKLKDL